MCCSTPFTCACHRFCLPSFILTATRGTDLDKVSGAFVSSVRAKSPVLQPEVSKSLLLKSKSLVGTSQSPVHPNERSDMKRWNVRELVCYASPIRLGGMDTPKNNFRCARQEVQRFISDNRRLLQAVYLLYAEPSVDGALISLQNFRYHAYMTSTK